MSNVDKLVSIKYRREYKDKKYPCSRCGEVTEHRRGINAGGEMWYRCKVCDLYT